MNYNGCPDSCLTVKAARNLHEAIPEMPAEKIIDMAKEKSPICAGCPHNDKAK